jgi:hypothetical protein
VYNFFALINFWIKYSGVSLAKLKKCYNGIKMTSDIIFLLKFGFPRNVHVKNISIHCGRVNSSGGMRGEGGGAVWPS